MHPAYHEKILLEETPQADRIGAYVVERFNPISVTDWGCSRGLYMKPFIDRGVKTHGFDNDPTAIRQAICSGIILMDLSKKFLALPRADFSISLEVGEHLPASAAEIFVENICNGTQNWILFSAAIPGQGDGWDGTLHINCQPLTYWIEIFEKNKFIVDFNETNRFLTWLKSGYHLGWAAANCMIFRRWTN